MDVEWDALLRWMIPLSFTAGVGVALLLRRRAGPRQPPVSTPRAVVGVVNGGLLGVVVGVLLAVLLVAVASP